MRTLVSCLWIKKISVTVVNVKEDTAWWQHALIGALGGLVWVILCILIICLCRRRRAMRKANKQSTLSGMKKIMIQTWFPSCLSRGSLQTEPQIKGWALAVLWKLNLVQCGPLNIASAVCYCVVQNPFKIQPFWKHLKKFSEIDVLLGKYRNICDFFAINW